MTRATNLPAGSSALAGLAIIGWALAAFLWSQDAQTRSQMTDLLNAAEKARESLAADLRICRKWRERRPT